MSEASPANSNTPGQGTGQGQSGTTSGKTPVAAQAGNSGNLKAIAMLIIGLGIGLVAGAFLAPFAENFFGVNNGIQPMKESGSPVQDERNTPSSPKTVPNATPAATPATDPAPPQDSKTPAAAPAPAAAPPAAPAPAPKN